jgi:hypothetical protein
MAAESLDGVGDQERAALCTLADMAIDGMIEIRDQLDRYRYCAHRAGGAA